MERHQHWNTIYRDKEPTNVSWFQATPTQSLKWIEESGLRKDEPLIDIGGGTSRLVDHLLAREYERITVLDIAKSALQKTRARLGRNALNACWMRADVTKATLPDQHFALWHDRAVFHFLTDAVLQSRYIAQATRAIRPNGTLIIATFALDGPTECSNLPIQRYSAESLAAKFSRSFQLEEATHETHITPWGSQQKFVYVRMQRL